MSSDEIDLDKYRAIVESRDLVRFSGLFESYSRDGFHLETLVRHFISFGEDWVEGLDWIHSLHNLAGLSRDFYDIIRLLIEAGFYDSLKFLQSSDVSSFLEESNFRRLIIHLSGRALSWYIDNGFTSGFSDVTFTSALYDVVIRRDFVAIETILSAGGDIFDTDFQQAILETNDLKFLNIIRGKLNHPEQGVEFGFDGLYLTTLKFCMSDPDFAPEYVNWDKCLSNVLRVVRVRDDYDWYTAFANIAFSHGVVINEGHFRLAIRSYSKRIVNSLIEYVISSRGNFEFLSDVDIIRLLLSQYLNERSSEYKALSTHLFKISTYGEK